MIFPASSGRFTLANQARDGDSHTVFHNVLFKLLFAFVMLTILAIEKTQDIFNKACSSMLHHLIIRYDLSGAVGLVASEL